MPKKPAPAAAPLSCKTLLASVYSAIKDEVTRREVVLGESVRAKKWDQLGYQSAFIDGLNAALRFLNAVYSVNKEPDASNVKSLRRDYIENARESALQRDEAVAMCQYHNVAGHAGVSDAWTFAEDVIARLQAEYQKARGE